MPQFRKTYKWYIERGLPVPAGVEPKITGYERKTWLWYTNRGLTPPAHLKPPKAVREGSSNVTRLMGNPAPAAFSAPLQPLPEVTTPEESEAGIRKRIKDRFDILETLVADVIEGDVRALIVSGPPGLGKSYTVEQPLQHGDVNCRIVKGFSRATGLFRLLYEFKDEGSILVLDDIDSIFEDLAALNLLKAATDTTEERVISWLAESRMTNEENGIPGTFTFEGSIIVLTNLDFDKAIQRGSKIGKHLEAIMSRAHYINLGMKSVRDCMVRIHQVCEETDMLGNLTKDQKASVLQFLEDNKSQLREISLRTALKVGTLCASGKANWINVAKVTCCK
jgi:hypothetical protein